MSSQKVLEFITNPRKSTLQPTFFNMAAKDEYEFDLLHAYSTIEVRTLKMCLNYHVVPDIDSK